MAKPKVLEDVIGMNMDDEVCHPYVLTKGPRKGLYSYTFGSTLEFKGATERQLRDLIERGAFNAGGSIRMVPARATSIGSSGAMVVKRYKGRGLPI